MNLEVLATKKFKVNMNLSPDLMNYIFQKRTNPYTYEEMTHFLFDK